MRILSTELSQLRRILAIINNAVSNCVCKGCPYQCYILPIVLSDSKIDKKWVLFSVLSLQEPIDKKGTLFHQVKAFLHFLKITYLMKKGILFGLSHREKRVKELHFPVFTSKNFVILKLPEPSTDFIVPFSDGVSFLTFERRQNQRKAHLYQLSISQVVTPCSMALMTTI